MREASEKPANCRHPFSTPVRMLERLSPAARANFEDKRTRHIRMIQITSARRVSQVWLRPSAVHQHLITLGNATSEVPVEEN